MYAYADTAMSYKVKKETLLETSPMNTEEKYTLIDAVRFYPELWDDRHLNFKDTAKRNQAWNFVVVQMQETHGKDFKEEVLARKNVERIKAWPFFDSLSYLDVILDQGPRFSSVCSAEQDVIVHFVKSSSTSTSTSRSRTPQSKNGSGGPGQNTDAIASAIKSLRDCNEKMDAAKISGMKFAMTLSEMREKKPLEYAKWSVKTDEFMLEMTRALHD
ncbi:hypothetical protein Q1695_013142 [Nippostrongylus brasiliensis]|nr:hypothetical protein Q1695_013142 [Nippostrongylus brasiliensis]